MLDSTEWQKMEAGLKVLVASASSTFHNLRRMGNEALLQGTELAKRYGAAWWWERLMKWANGRTAEGKFAIAQRAIATPLNSAILPTISTTPLALPISTGIEEDRAMCAPTIEGVRRIPGPASRRSCVLG